MISIFCFCPGAVHMVRYGVDNECRDGGTEGKFHAIGSMHLYCMPGNEDNGEA